MITGTQGVFPPSGVLVTVKTDTGVDNDPPTDVPSADLRADVLDFPGDIGAAPVRHVQSQAGPPPADPDVQVIERTSPHPDHDLIGAGFRIRNIAIADGVEFAVFIKIERFHDTILRISAFKW
jgi:hypothetical protein